MKRLSCNVDNETYQNFAQMAKSRNYTHAAYLRQTIKSLTESKDKALESPNTQKGVFSLIPVIVNLFCNIYEMPSDQKDALTKKLKEQ